MRILFFSNWLPPIRSGSAYYTSSLAQALIRQGHEVMVVTLDWGPGDAPSRDLSFPIKVLPVVRLPQCRLFFNLKRVGVSTTPLNFKRLKKIMAEFRPDMVHHVNHIFESIFMSGMAARALKIPVVGSITTPIQHQNPLAQALMECTDRWSVGWFGVRKWDAIISLDRTVHDYVGKAYGKKVQEKSYVVPFGVRLEMQALYEQSVQKSPVPQILMAGHIHPFRNPVQLVRAMPLILKEIPNARLILAGRVDLKDPVKAAQALGLNERNLQFLGETPHDKMVELMKTSHLFASWVTGPYKSLGTAPMEAMLCRTPVMNDIPEDLFGEGKLKNGENFICVNSLDPQSIAQAAIKVLKEEALQKKIGEGGRRFVLDHLSWESIANGVLKVYESVLQGKPSRKELRLPEPLKSL